jgi:hypothetical protein
MLAANTYEDICQELRWAFKHRYSSTGKAGVKMVGILFAPAKSPLVVQEILPRINDYHHMSGNNVDFFCCGYGAYWPDDQDIEVVAEVGEDTPWERRIVKWQYSSKIFTDIVKQFKKMTTWKYSGEVDLILANARYDDAQDTAYVDLSSSIVLKLDEMRKDCLIQSVGTLFQEIFDYAENESGEDDTWGFSDSKGIKVLWQALESVVLKLLPVPARQLWRKGKHFAVIDVSV